MSRNSKPDRPPEGWLRGRRFPANPVDTLQTQICCCICGRSVGQSLLARGWWLIGLLIGRVRGRAAGGGKEAAKLRCEMRRCQPGREERGPVWRSLAELK